MSALRDLELRYDGPLPPGAAAAAIWADLETSRARLRSPVKLRVKEWKPAGIIDRMAEVMRQVTRQRGRCWRQDLANAGFSSAQIFIYQEDARALAARRDAAANIEYQQPEFLVTDLLAAARRQREAA